jgi:hypothetical protein
MEEQEGREAGGDQRRVTRRAAIATGAGAYAGSMLWAASSVAAASSPKQLLEQLRREVVGSTVKKPLKPNLTTIIGDALTDLARGRNGAARKVLEEQLIPLLQSDSGRHGLGARQAKEWVADAENVVSKIPGLKAGGNGSVYVFNCFNEPMGAFTVAGKSAGRLDGWSNGGGGKTLYTPAGLQVPRARSKTPGEFANGDNAVSIRWDSFDGTATIKIPGAEGSVSLLDDLILLVALNGAMVQTTRGIVLATPSIDVSYGG